MRIDRVKLAAVMVSKDINGKQLAKLSGLSRSTITAVRSGKRCSIDSAMRIVRALGVDVVSLMEEEQNQKEVST